MRYACFGWLAVMALPAFAAEGPAAVVVPLGIDETATSTENRGAVTIYGQGDIVDAHASRMVAPEVRDALLAKIRAPRLAGLDSFARDLLLLDAEAFSWADFHRKHPDWSAEQYESLRTLRLEKSSGG